MFGPKMNVETLLLLPHNDENGGKSDVMDRRDNGGDDDAAERA